MRFQRILLAASLSMLLAAPAAAKRPTRPDPSCPTILNGFKTADNVGAAFKLSRSIFPVTGFYFSSFMNENPVGGVPGLVQYCVYLKTPITLPRLMSVLATGADGERWMISLTTTVFSFARPDGDGSNIPLDGTTTEMGWMFLGGIPPIKTILLQINDAEECTSLYGARSPDTCFVNPGA